MTGVMLGYGAYSRLYAGEPQIRLENRFLEANPTNLKEQTALLTRPGTSLLLAFSNKPFRRAYAEVGLFDHDLMVVTGNELWRYDGVNQAILVQGSIDGTGAPSMSWVKGEGYERLFIADGLRLQWYGGGTRATATLSISGAITDEVVAILGDHYMWDSNVDGGSPDGTALKPWRVRDDADPLQALADALMTNGIPGVDFSSGITAPNVYVTAVPAGGPPATSMLATSRSQTTSGNTVTVSVSGTSPVLSWSSPTLTGGGLHGLTEVRMPDGLPAKACCGLKSHMVVSVGHSQRFYWLTPGSVVIDPLNFANKESNADNVQDLQRVGDNMLVIGEISTESWYFTGEADVPFAPVNGRAYNRGATEGTTVVVKDSVIFVGDDGIVYRIGYGAGGGELERISNHGIEERIRRQLRREVGLVP